MTPARIAPAEVRRRMLAGDPLLLVCAYEDDDKFRQAPLEGAISRKTLRNRMPSLSKEQQIVFYCG
ncbi:MAG: rhodanese-like domain-containing protein [Planctomycetota bacterium]